MYPDDSYTFLSTYLPERCRRRMRRLAISTSIFTKEKPRSGSSARARACGSRCVWDSSDGCGVSSLSDPSSTPWVIQNATHAPVQTTGPIQGGVPGGLSGFGSAYYSGSAIGLSRGAKVMAVGDAQFIGYGFWMLERDVVKRTP